MSDVNQAELLSKLERARTFIEVMDKYACCMEKEGHWKRIDVLRKNVGRILRQTDIAVKEEQR